MFIVTKTFLFPYRHNFDAYMQHNSGYVPVESVFFSPLLNIVRFKFGHNVAGASNLSAQPRLH